PPHSAEDMTAIADQFSADWTLAAYADTDGNIRVLRYNKETARYTPHFDVASENASEGIRYSNPKFSKNNHRLWFEATGADGSKMLMSVDYIQPGKPRKEQGLPEGDTSWELSRTGCVIQRTDAEGREHL